MSCAEHLLCICMDNVTQVFCSSRYQHIQNHSLMPLRDMQIQGCTQKANVGSSKSWDAIPNTASHSSRGSADVQMLGVQETSASGLLHSHDIISLQQGDTDTKFDTTPLL